jgi:hypothetical protein
MAIRRVNALARKARNGLPGILRSQPHGTQAMIGGVFIEAEKRAMAQTQSILV